MKQSLFDLRDAARQASKSAHDRMKFEQMVYDRGGVSRGFL